MVVVGTLYEEYELQYFNDLKVELNFLFRLLAVHFGQRSADFGGKVFHSGCRDLILLQYPWLQCGVMSTILAVFTHSMQDH